MGTEKHRELGESYQDLVEKHKELAKKREDIIQLLRDKVECPVCLYVPKKAPIPVCPNGHVVCSKCVRGECPTCRVKMGQGKSTLAVTVIENIDHECENEGCQEKFQLGELANHGKCCFYRPVKCPYCDVQISLASLPTHMESSSTCWGSKIESHEMPREIDYETTMTDMILDEDETWDPECMRYDGRIFVVKVARCKVGGNSPRRVFMVQMVGEEEETAKYRATIIVQRPGGDDPGGKCSLRYHGDICPIDVTSVQAADDKGMCLTLTDGAMKTYLVDEVDVSGEGINWNSDWTMTSTKHFLVVVDLYRQT